MQNQTLSFGPSSALIINQHMIDWEVMADKLKAENAPAEQVQDVDHQIALLTNQLMSLQQNGRLTINFPPAGSPLELIQRSLTDWQMLHDQLEESNADADLIDYCEEAIASLTNAEFDLINRK